MTTFRYGARYEWQQMARRAARKKGWEPGNTEFQECTCLEVRGPTWDCDAEYEEDPVCWEHGEDLDRAEWCLAHGEEWCLENGVNPITGEPADGGEWD